MATLAEQVQGERMARIVLSEDVKQSETRLVTRSV